MATVLHPGRLSPARQVPADIQRPEYVGRKHPKTGEPDVKTPEIIERMRVAGHLAAQALAAVGAAVAPGVTTDYLDQVGHDYLVSHGAYPSTLGYRGYPKSLCTSLNEVICHGIPDDTLINDGDIVNIDITAYIDGVHGDTNATFLAGNVDEESRLLVERTHEAMMRGIRAVAPGRPLNAIGRVIASAIDLSAFTGTSAPVRFQPDVTALGLTAAAAMVLALVALAAEATSVRRRGITGILRAE